MEPLTEPSAVELARRIRAGEVSARDVVEAHLHAIETRGARTNAVVTTDVEAARAAAAAADEAVRRGDPLGPLHGVPITVKDTFDVAGMRTTSGLPWLRDHRPPTTARQVERLRAAGAIVLGKTNLPFASYDWQCDDSPFGRCHNPHRAGYTPGGSSSGAAAAVADHLSPLDIGSDVAGSIRWPAHCCGVFGMRTSEGLLEGEGHGNIPGLTPSVRNLVAFGPLARHAEDLQLALEVLAPTHTALGRLARATRPRPGRELRVAFTPCLAGVQPCADTRDVFARALRRIGAEVAEVVEHPGPFDAEEALALWGAIQGFELRAAYPWPTRNLLGRRVVRHLYLPRRFGASTFVRELGRGFDSSFAAYVRAQERRDQLIDATDRFFERFDAWITPAAPGPAFAYRSPREPIPVDDRRVAYGDFVSSYQCSTAVTRHPIVAMPAGRARDGLPIGLQVHGPRGGDFALLALTAELHRWNGDASA
jgi:amidase